MQLFLIESPIIVGSTITLTDESLLHQMNRVLRMRLGDECFLQWSEGSSIQRTNVSLTHIDKKTITCTILSQESKEQLSKETRLAVARPNKPAKMELIVQKLTELGVSEIIFFKAQRSQPGHWNEKKAMRIQTIVKEATEQSRGRTSPIVSYYETLDEIPGVATCIVTDIPGRLSGEWSGKIDGPELFFVGPEGGRGDRDYEFFSSKNAVVLELGDRVLRMETAAIVVGSKMMAL